MNLQSHRELSFEVAFDNATIAVDACHMRKVISCTPSCEVCVLWQLRLDMLTCDNLLRWRQGKTRCAIYSRRESNSPYRELHS